MAGKYARRPDEIARSETLPPDLECLAGTCGPYVKTDRAEFYHAGKEIQEWILRADGEEVALLKFTLRLGQVVKSAIKWGIRIFWAFTGGLAAVSVAGERLAKLPQTISGALSGVSGALQVLRGLIGL